MALKYANSQQFKTMPALKDSNREIITIIKIKKVLVQKLAFSKSPISLKPELQIISEITYIKVIIEAIRFALITQAVKWSI